MPLETHTPTTIGMSVQRCLTINDRFSCRSLRLVRFCFFPRLQQKDCIHCVPSHNAEMVLYVEIQIYSNHTRLGLNMSELRPNHRLTAKSLANCCAIPPAGAAAFAESGIPGKDMSFGFPIRSGKPPPSSGRPKLPTILDSD